MRNACWTFHVHGIFIRASSGEILTPCTAIVESGVRDDASPFSFFAVGKIAHADVRGAFETDFFTIGSDAAAAMCPSTVSVFVKIAQGEWRPCVVAVDPSRCSRLAANEWTIDLGRVPIEHDVYADPD